MAKVDDILRDAMVGTEKEVFGDAFDIEDVVADESGDRSPESMGDGLEGQHEPEEGDDEDDEVQDGQDEEGKAKDGEQGDSQKAADGKTKVKPEAEDDDGQPDARGRVPAGRYRETAEAKRKAEEERDALKSRLEQIEANHRRAMDEQNARLEQIVRSFNAGQRQQTDNRQQQRQADGLPDVFEDPKGYSEYIVRTAEERAAARIAAHEQSIRADRINFSMDSARQRHGDTLVEAYKALTSLDPSDPDNRAFVQRITATPDPGEAIVRWHKRNQVLARIGSDPDAYERQIAEKQRQALLDDPEVIKEVMSRARRDASGGDNGQPRNEYRLPPSLGRTAGNAGRAPDDRELFDDSPQAIFNSAMR